jgi:hypothetical protein
MRRRTIMDDVQSLCCGECVVFQRGNRGVHGQ